MRGLNFNRTRGRKARREGGGNQDNPRDEKPLRSVPEHDEDFDIVSRTTYECLSFGRQKKQKRQGAVFRTGSPPKKVSVGYLRPLQPENSSYPLKGKDRRKVIVRPLSKGGKWETSTSGRMRWEQACAKGQGGVLRHLFRRGVTRGKLPVEKPCGAWYNGFNDAANAKGGHYEVHMRRVRIRL